ncbi:MAG: acyl transferase, partial [Bacteroidota bacterium]
LVYMVKDLILEYGLPGSGFYLDDLDALHQALSEAMDRREPIFLIGVSFALLDFAEQYALRLPAEAVVMETGGMKGRRKEMVRAELHAHLKAGLGVSAIHSEYGMTELLSQAYAVGDRFHCPPWMRVHITDLYVPGKLLPPGQRGRLCITDLANVESCAFIATDDVGIQHEDGSFEVLGRMDHAALRGCNLLYES